MSNRWAVLPFLLLLPALSRAGDEPPSEMRKPGKLTLDTFKLAVREAKCIEEKAALLHAFGATAPADAPSLSEISRYLGALSGDIRLLLPSTAISILGRFRGNRTASQNLVQALPAFKKSPYMQKKIIGALTQIAHESAIPTLEEILRGGDEDMALHVLAALRDLPPDASLDLMIRSWDWMEGRKAKASDTLRNAYGRLGGEMLKRVQEISGEKYPTMTEMSRWWPKHSAEWKEKSAAMEKEKPAGVLAALPPSLLVELSFNDRAAAWNGGVSAAWCPSGLITKGRPAWSTEVPPVGGASSLDWGREGGAAAVDLVGVADHLKNLKSFTVTGWINCRSAAEGKGGNRILSWLDKDGVEIVHRADGSLQVGINQKAEDSEIRTASAVIPVLAEGPGYPIYDNWRYFAVTYDATTAAGEVKIYLGYRDHDAVLCVSKPGPGKPGARVAAAFSIGNLPPAARAAQPAGGFRGWIDEIRIYGSTWDGSGALAPADVVKIQNRT